ncbi:hypothetical protein DET50_1451, partial [Marinobacter pelagius]
ASLDLQLLNIEFLDFDQDLLVYQVFVSEQPGSTRIGQENVARLFRNEDLVHEQILVEVEEFYVEQLEIERGRLIVEIAETKAAASRARQALERLQEVVPDMIRRTLGFMQEYGIEPPESVQKALQARGYIEPPDKPEKPPESVQKALQARGYIEPPDKPEKPPERPLNSLEREFQHRQQQRDDHDDEHQGPGLG